MGYALCGEEKSQRFGIKCKDFPTNGYFLGTGLTRGREEPIQFGLFASCARGLLRMGIPP